MWRIRIVYILFIIIYCLIVLRLCYLYLFWSDKLRSEALSQYYSALQIPASRGQIMTSDGNTLVLNRPAYLVYAKPREISDLTRFSQKIAPILNLDLVKLPETLAIPGRVWVPLARRVSPEIKSVLEQTKLPGLGFEPESVRFYPEASLAAHILGFVGSDEAGLDQGYFGLEGYYDRELKGKSGSLLQEKDVRGVPILVGENRRIDKIDGRSLVLWLDRVVERIAETRLKEGIRKYGAKEGSVIIMDPVTGGVLAMATYPSYAPNKFLEYDKELYKNPLVASSYEPGSTFKVLVMGAAINEKLVTPITTMEETGAVKIGEYAIKTWNDTYRGTINMTDVLVHSSNVGMVFVGRKLGREKLLSYIRAYGFGSPTGVDLQEESSPKLRSDSDWSEIDLATASFGQGIAVTPIQMVTAVAALANGGQLMQPKIVKEIRDTAGKTVTLAPQKVRQVLSPAAAKTIAEMMVTAVDNGEAKWTKVKGYRIAGKTGTAQIAVSGHYDQEKTIASFVGFAPADNPKFVMLVTLREPQSSPWGSETAAPLFFAIARDLFNYFGIPPQ